MNAGFRGGIADDTDRLAGTLACARVGLCALTADRKTAQMTHAPITFDALKALKVHSDFSSQITLDNIFAILDSVNDLRELLLSEILRPDAGIDIGPREDFLRIARTDAVNVAQRNVRRLIIRNIDTENTRHRRVLSTLAFACGADCYRSHTIGRGGGPICSSRRCVLHWL